MRFGEMPDPEVRDDDVLVQIHAASVNPLDSKIRDGEFKRFLPYRLRQYGLWRGVFWCWERTLGSPIPIESRSAVAASLVVISLLRGASRACRPRRGCRRVMPGIPGVETIRVAASTLGTHRG